MLDALHALPFVTNRPTGAWVLLALVVFGLVVLDWLRWRHVRAIGDAFQPADPHADPFPTEAQDRTYVGPSIYQQETP